MEYPAAPQANQRNVLIIAEPVPCLLDFDQAAAFPGLTTRSVRRSRRADAAPRPPPD